MTEPERIPLSEPMLGAAESANLAQCIAEGWVSAKGRFVREFEARFASIHECDEAVSTSSGTAALHLALLALGIGPGDEVLVPSLTFAATANAVWYTGAKPVLVDVDPDSYTVTTETAAAGLSPATRAIIAVHLYGNPADIDPVGELAERRGLHLIEDATEALGSRYKGRMCGTVGDVGCFSFNGNKLITTGGGGMLLARDPAVLARARHLSLQARVPGTIEYEHDDVGFNYALSNLHAAVGLAQLGRLDDLLARRRLLAMRYAAQLAGVPGLRFSLEPPETQSSYWLMSVLIDESQFGCSRGEVIEALAADSIETRPFFTPLHLLAPYAADAALCPVAEHLHRQGVSLPSSASLDAAHQDRVIAALVGHRRRRA